MKALKKSCFSKLMASGGIGVNEIRTREGEREEGQG